MLQTEQNQNSHSGTQYREIHMISSMIVPLNKIPSIKNIIFADLQSSSCFSFWRREILAEALKYWCFFIVNGLNNSF